MTSIVSINQRRIFECEVGHIRHVTFMLALSSELRKYVEATGC